MSGWPPASTTRSTVATTLSTAIGTTRTVSRHSLTSAHHADVPACLSLEICVDYFQQTVETCGAVAIRDLWRYNATHDGPAREDANAAGCTQDHPSATPSSGGRCVFEEALLSAEAQRLIAGHARVAAYKSFFLFYAMHLVHMPLQIPTAYERNFSFIDDPYVSPPRPLTDLAMAGQLHRDWTGGDLLSRRWRLER